MMAKQSVIGFVTNVTEESSSLKDRPEMAARSAFLSSLESGSKKKSNSHNELHSGPENLKKSRQKNS